MEAQTQPADATTDAYTELLRPQQDGAASSIPAPSEAAMISEFGALLPPAKYLTTSHGRAAYYLYPPNTTTTTTSSQPTRILLVHGVQTPALGLQPLATALRTAYPHASIALLDHWGHGLSATPRAAHTPPLFHALLDSVLDALGWPSAHLVGYSFGGVTVASYATKRRVESMVLVAPAGLIRGGDKGQARDAGAVMRFLEGNESGEVVVPADWRERVARGEVVAEAVRAWQLRVHRGHLASVVGIVRDGGVLDSHEVFVKAVETGVPMLAVVGETDDICGVEDLEAVGVKNVVEIPNVGHAVVRERVPEVVAHIKAFWGSH